MDAQYDKTWCVQHAGFLKKADPDELQFYEQYKPRGLVSQERDEPLRPGSFESPRRNRTSGDLRRGWQASPR
jgi:hypothetical protein